MKYEKPICRIDEYDFCDVIASSSGDDSSLSKDNNYDYGSSYPY